MSGADPITLHATAVAAHGRAVALIGRSGSGKSSLALEMMARGAALVADDRVILTPAGDEILCSCPEPLRGKIEARGVGILHAAYASDVPLGLVVDMDHAETDRLPEALSIAYFTQTLPLLHKVESQHFPAAILQYLAHRGRAEPLI
jgi:HPr kinase/phosphorylase